MNDYFALLDLPRAYTLDMAQLKEQYQRMQKQWHPDKFMDQDASQQKQAMQKATDINAAYQTLQEPVARANHLLELHQQSFNAEASTVSDTDFLMAQLELREQLEEAESIESLESLQDEAQDWLNNLIREFQLDYQQEDWAEARDTVKKMQFMQKLVSEIHEQIARIEDEEWD